jgi:hypothetical protein
VGFEPTIPVYERAKTVHALDHAAGRCDQPLPLLQVLNLSHNCAVISEPVLEGPCSSLSLANMGNILLYYIGEFLNLFLGTLLFL